MYTREFEWDRDSNGEYGWIPLFMGGAYDEDIDAGGPMTVAHDAVEHFCDDPTTEGNVETELLAVGAFGSGRGMRNRARLGVGIYHYDLLSMGERYSFDDMARPATEENPARNIRRDIRAVFNDLRQSDRDEALNLARNRHTVAALIQRGNERAFERFGGNIADVFDQCQNAVAALGYDFETGTRLTVEVDPETWTVRAGVDNLLDYDDEDDDE